MVYGRPSFVFIRSSRFQAELKARVPKRSRPIHPPVQMAGASVVTRTLSSLREQDQISYHVSVKQDLDDINIPLATCLHSHSYIRFLQVQ